MANEEHLAILRQGVAVWNAWREDNPNVRPNLVEAELSEADLKGVYLNVANLTRVHLVRARLNRANLRSGGRGTRVLHS